MGNSSSSSTEITETTENDFEPLEMVGLLAPQLADLATYVADIAVTDFLNDPVLTDLVNAFFYRTQQTFLLFLHLENYIENMKQRQTRVLSAIDNFLSKNNDQSVSDQLIQRLREYAEETDRLSEFQSRLEQTIKAHDTLVKYEKPKKPWYQNVVKFVESAILTLSIIGHALVASFSPQSSHIARSALPFLKVVFLEIKSINARNKDGAAELVREETYNELNKVHYRIKQEVTTVKLNVLNVSTAVNNAKKVCKQASEANPKDSGFQRHVPEVTRVVQKVDETLDEAAKEIKESKKSVMEARQEVTRSISNKGANFK